MKVKCSIDPKSLPLFYNAINEIARRTKGDKDEVLAHEVHSILEASLKFTEVAKASSINQYYKQKEQYTFSEGSNGFTGSPKILVDGKLYSFGRKYPDKIWRKIVRQNNVNRRERLSRRGLAKKSWLDIANDFGMLLKKAPDYVSKAKAHGQPVEAAHGVISKSGNGNVTMFEGTNKMKSALSLGGKGWDAFRRAFAGRIKFFEKNMKKRAFKTVEGARSKYPIFTAT